jgi:glyoxylase I family protein
MLPTRSKLQIKKLDHCALVVRDIERSRHFYGDVLGLVEIPRPKSFLFRGAWFRGAGFELHLIQADETAAPVGFGDPGEGGLVGLAHHLAFEVADLDAALEHLRSHGVEILSGPMPRGDGVLQAYFFDPDANFLEFFIHDGDSSLRVEERRGLGGQDGA